MVARWQCVNQLFVLGADQHGASLKQQRACGATGPAVAAGAAIRGKLAPASATQGDRTLKTILASLFAALVLASLFTITIQAANGTLSPSAGDHCGPLPPPTGPIVTVSSESELRSQATNAAAGTTIVVSAGTYNLQNIVHVVNSGLTIRGATGNRDDVILDAGGMGSGLTHGILIDVDADDVTIADLTIRNAGEHGVSIQGSDRPTLYNLHIVDTGSQLVKVNPWENGSEDGLLACSRLEYTTTAPDDYTNGISAHRAHRWVVRDNEWYRIRGPGSGCTGPYADPHQSTLQPLRGPGR